ncbi:MAG TPA: hypothetical protein DCQ98_11645 [Planctomycetaceae bacterium]|nr:hypothetical protein [Planctomycetaceae bacterium]
MSVVRRAAIRVSTDRPRPKTLSSIRRPIRLRLDLPRLADRTPGIRSRTARDRLDQTSSICQ